MDAYQQSGTTYVYVLTLVHSFDRLLAAGVAGTFSVSAGVDFASSIPNCRDRGGRSFGTAQGADHAAGAGPGRKQSLTEW